MMTQADVTDVSRVERRCFANPWPASAYRRELRNRDQNHYVVLRATAEQPPEHGEHDTPHLSDGIKTYSRWSLIPFHRRAVPPQNDHIAGFAGMWIVFDEAHITTIGVDPMYRGRGFGELLFLALVDEAIRRGVTWLTLEVRVSNLVAQELYRKYGFVIQGIRHGYYSDNGEDAYVMWSRSLRDPDYLAQIDELREQLRNRLGPAIEVPSAPSGRWSGPSRNPFHQNGNSGSHPR
jgi:ribosomal-protein-alanine N-acetyltransferase